MLSGGSTPRSLPCLLRHGFCAPPLTFRMAKTPSRIRTATRAALRDPESELRPNRETMGVDAAASAAALRRALRGEAADDAAVATFPSMLSSNCSPFRAAFTLTLSVASPTIKVPLRSTRPAVRAGFVLPNQCISRPRRTRPVLEVFAERMILKSRQLRAEVTVEARVPSPDALSLPERRGRQVFQVTCRHDRRIHATRDTVRRRCLLSRDVDEPTRSRLSASLPVP